jgi:hypothetical protein
MKTAYVCIEFDFKVLIGVSSRWIFFEKFKKKPISKNL